MVKTTFNFAQATYSCGNYGESTYQGDCTATTGTGSNPLDNLANTGFDVLIPVFLGISLVFASALLMARRLLRKRAEANASRV